MSKLNKKALSNIVISILLVLLAIIAVSFVALTLNKLIKPNLSPELSCLDLQIGQSIIIQKACYNSTTSDVEVTLRRSIDTEIDSLDFTINMQGESSSWSCSSFCSDCSILGKGEIKTYYFHVENFNNNEENTIKVLTGSCLLDSRNIKKEC
jgi:hypothetical protein